MQTTAQMISKPATTVTCEQVFNRTVLKVGSSAYVNIPKRLSRQINLQPGDIVSIAQSSETGLAIVKIANGPRHTHNADPPNQQDTSPSKPED